MPRHIAGASILLPLAVLAAVLLCSDPASAATWYVDYDGGADSANGQSSTTAFQHCPGDPAATAVAKATVPAAGDVVLFKGGVHYRGNVVIPSSGAAGNPVIWDGNTAGTFGTGRAILDGAERLTGWTACQSAADCGDNPNWRNIYYAYAPAGLNPGTANLYADNQMCWMAQGPNVPDPFFMDDISSFYSVPAGAMTTTSVTDPVHLNQSDAGHWAGAYAMLWVQPNVVAYRKILSFDPATSTLTYDATGTPYTDRNGLYAIYNSLHLIDTPGEYYLNETPEPDGRLKVYLWPPAAGDPNQREITVSRRTLGVDLGGREFVTVQGFRIEKQSGSGLHDGIGVKALSWNLSPRNLTIRDNQFFGIRHHPDRGYGAVYIYGGSDCLIEGNTVDEMPVNMGFLLGGLRPIVRNNTLSKCGSQTIWFMGATDGQIIGNTVRDGRGTHANGISVYSNSSNILVFGNTVLDSNIAITVQQSANVTLAYNLCINPSFYVIADWGGCTNLKVHNNTMIRDEDKPSLTVSSSGAQIRNNLGLTFASSGSTVPDANGNLYCKHSQLGSLVNDYLNRDFRLKAGSTAINAGLTLGYASDLVGTPVPLGSAPDIGAYEYLQGAAITTWSLVAPHGQADLAATLPEGAVVATIQGVRKLRLTFAASLDAATVGPAAITLTGQISGSQAARIQSVVLIAGDSLEITLAEPLPDGDWYTLAVTSALRTQDNGIVLGDADLRFGTLAGDADGSAQVTLADLLAIRAHVGKEIDASNARYDLDGSGAITGADMMTARDFLGRQLP